MRLVSRVTWLLVLFFGTSIASRSEGNCPTGMVPIGGGQAQGASCMPVGGAQQSRQPYWQNRYGAIAAAWVLNKQGSYSLVLGTASNMRSKRKAEKQAISQCKAKGSKTCSVLNYNNQCAAIALGDEYYASRGAETEDVAAQLAMDGCSSKTKNCKVYYTDCSLPELVK
jgi:hypothetical protein